MTTPFSRSTFYVSIGLSVLNSNQCCVVVDQEEPPMILKPPHDQRYIVCDQFKFEAPRKVPFAAIMSNLKYAGVLPVDKDVTASINPGNKFYTKLDIHHYPLIMEVIRKTIEGISFHIEIKKDNFPEKFSISYNYSEKKFDKNEREKARINMDDGLISIDKPIMILLSTEKVGEYTTYDYGETGEDDCILKRTRSFGEENEVGEIDEVVPNERVQRCHISRK